MRHDRGPSTGFVSQNLHIYIYTYVLHTYTLHFDHCNFTPEDIHIYMCNLAPEDIHIYVYIHTYIHTYIYVYIYMSSGVRLRCSKQSMMSIMNNLYDDIGRRSRHGRRIKTLTFYILNVFNKPISNGRSFGSRKGVPNL